jgi:hypothetical protein
LNDRRRTPIRVFVSYRRGDTAAYAGRLYDALAARLGDENVFMDVDAIELGTEFRSAIDGAVAASDVVLALIGRGWLDAPADDGRRRLDDPDDVLRLELEAALAHERVVIPVCVQGAPIPSAEELPTSLAPLASRQGIELRDTSWRDDVGRLLRRLERLAAPPDERPATRRLGIRSALALAAAAVAAVATAIALLPGDDPGAPRGGSAEARLLAAIPLPQRTSCSGTEDGPDAALAHVSCPSGRAAVVYHLFESEAVLGRWYAFAREEIGIAPGSGSCTADAFAGESGYDVDGEDVGRWACYLDAGVPELIFTDERANVGAEANIWDDAEAPDAPESMLRLWDCCLKLEP